MTIDCSLIYHFNTWKLQAQNMGRRFCAHKLFFVFVLTFRTIFAHNMFSPCSELVVFMYWNGKSMNNRLSYSGLVDPRISASDKDLPVPDVLLLSESWEVYYCLKDGKVVFRIYLSRNFFEIGNVFLPLWGNITWILLSVIILKYKFQQFISNSLE